MTSASPATVVVPRRALAAGAALLALGFVAGHVWADQHGVRTMTGTATRLNDENQLVTFDGDDGTQLPIIADAVAWESQDGSQSGDGTPPCLGTPLKKVRVEVGVVDGSLPDGGGPDEHVIWVRCP
ncbi:hypothetical protein [Aeromicrobium sp. IC_218]|uniref:hypothetical protein n=1 Tax=Aeromicrobium sp. IC_218 TaxID=2545468 RepID=UPI00103A0DBB|nr:hypothetical protein [Aeromicrobium sp. IC_218]TCJ00329.1 hypothetical protein E0W78_03830 [Aeromicrobium sp. IC_218]